MTESSTPPIRKWTIAIDLAVNLPIQGEFGRMGAEDKLKRLEQLRLQTKDSPVTLVVQDVVASKTATGSQQRSHQLTRRVFVIEDGQIVQRDEAPSRGLAQDLQDLIHYSSSSYPSERYGVVVNSHGLGDPGLSGDSGQASMASVETSVKNGLAGSGHDKVDLFNWDACLMAQIGVLDAMSPVAKHLIASADIENTGTANPSVDGQNLNAWLSKLIEEPTMDGGKLGDVIVNEADLGSNDSPDRKETATRTLAHFDLEKMPQFDRAFGDFSTALLRAASIPENRNAINDTINSAPLEYPAARVRMMQPPQNLAEYANFLHFQQRDVGGLAELIKMQIEAKSIKDPDGSLEKATRDLVEAQKAITKSFHGPGKNTIDYSSGLSMFLPSPDLLDTRSLAEALNSKPEKTPDEAKTGPTFANKKSIEETKNSLDAVIDQAFKNNPETHTKPWHQLFDAVK